MTTFIDFRYSRALAAALFAGQEKEETRIDVNLTADNFFVLGIAPQIDGIIATLTHEGCVVASIGVRASGIAELCDERDHLLAKVQLDRSGDNLIGVRIGPDVVGLRVGETSDEVQWKAPVLPVELHLHNESVKLMGQGTGRVKRWGELFYHRNKPTGLCVQLTMDWHHLRAGIPLFGTMTAEHLIEAGKFRLRFSSYAYESADAETTDFVRLFGSNDAADIAVHLTPALYNPRVPGIPNLAFAVIESISVHPHLVERCNQMDEILVPTTFTAEVFRKSGVTRPIHVVSHGVDTSYYRPPDVPRPLPGGSDFNFLAVATHVERKNIRHLVKAFLEEFRTSDDVALFLLLRPEYHTSQNNVALEFTEWEREYAHESSAPIYLWTGYLTRDHLRDFYANSDCYVMPSNEGFGLTVLEAMACATPVIALDHGGVTDFVNGHNGALVAKGREYVATDIDTLPYVGDRFYEPDMTELKRAMRDVYTNRLQAKQKSRSARAECESRLTWQAVTAEFSQHIEETYERYHDQNRPVDGRQESRLTLALCIMDDESAAKSLDYLARLGDSIRVLCLFTRYARTDDVLRARKHGFSYYRWNGTLDNALVIARSIVGRKWIGVLNNGERLFGSFQPLVAFLESQPASVATVSINGEARFYHLRPESEAGETVLYGGLSISR